MDYFGFNHKEQKQILESAAFKKGVDPIVI
jgi:hypothetical protein